LLHIPLEHISSEQICKKRCNFWTFAKSLLILSFLFGKQFWASLHLLSESGWNWCPWQALVSFRFPTHVHCKFMFLSFSCKVGGFFSVQGCINILDWLKYLLLCSWKLSWTLFSQVPIMYLIFLPWAPEIFRLTFEVSWAHGKILELRDMPRCANLRLEKL